MIFWAIVVKIGVARATKEENKRIYQDAEAKRLELLKMDYPASLPDDMPTQDWYKGAKPGKY